MYRNRIEDLGHGIELDTGDMPAIRYMRKKTNPLTRVRSWTAQMALKEQDRISEPSRIEGGCTTKVTTSAHMGADTLMGISMTIQ